MTGDIIQFDGDSLPYAPSRPQNVAAGTTASINYGEPVSKALGAAVVTAMATNLPVVGTDFLAGISTSVSTETTTAAGKVMVQDAFHGMTFLITPNNPLLWDTQAEYDALVGARVLIDLTAGVYTLLAADGATNGVVVEPLDISVFPGKVRISFREGVNYLA